jgi:hypothetical protein
MEDPMSDFSLRDPATLGAIAAIALCAGSIFAYRAMRKRPSDEELEQLRRTELVQSGRIVDGTILDISDVGPHESGRPSGMQLIIYKYDVAGVSYECSQDVTNLGDYVNIYDCRLGFPCSVRYDPHRPINSIVVAETWSGLRNTANSVPVRVAPRNSRATYVRN